MDAKGVVEVLERRAALVEELRAVPEDERTVVFVAATQAPGEMRATYARIPQPPAPLIPTMIDPAAKMCGTEGIEGAKPTPTESGEESAQEREAKMVDACRLPRPFSSVPSFEKCLRDLPIRGVGLRDYIVSEAPQSPVLRQLTHALYDTLIVSEEGQLGNRGLVNLFSDCRWFPDHTPKSERDCNLTADGLLGYPLMYDLRRIELVFEKWSHPDDVRRVLKGIVLKWIRGQNVSWLRVTLSGFEPFIAADWAEADAVKKEMLRDILHEGVWSHYRTSVLTKDGRPQRIESTESFRVEASCPAPIGELHGPVRLKILLQDTLYTCI